jgi:hypothetical protein
MVHEPFDAAAFASRDDEVIRRRLAAVHQLEPVAPPPGKPLSEGRVNRDLAGAVAGAAFGLEWPALVPRGEVDVAERLRRRVDVAPSSVPISLVVTIQARGIYAAVQAELAIPIVVEVS